MMTSSLKDKPGLQVHGRHTSYNVQKVLWLLDELAMDYRHIEVGGRFGGNQSEAFLALNPHGKVPVLCDGKKVVWESNTILRYLADTYAPGKWISLDPFDRTLVDRWLDWSVDRLETAFVDVFWGYYRTPEAQRNPEKITAAVSAYEHCLESLSRQIGSQHYLNGSTPTLADIANGVFLHRIHAIELIVNMPNNVFSWYARLTERSAFKRWAMSDFSELKGRCAY